MTTATPFATGTNSAGVNALPTPPTGWPIGSYATYEEAQRAVDHLADNDFPVADVTIVGIEPMIVERVTGRLTWGRVLGAGAARDGPRPHLVLPHREEGEQAEERVAVAEHTLDGGLLQPEVGQERDLLLAREL